MAEKCMAYIAYGAQAEESIQKAVKTVQITIGDVPSVEALRRGINTGLPALEILRPSTESEIRETLRLSGSHIKVANPAYHSLLLDILYAQWHRQLPEEVNIASLTFGDMLTPYSDNGTRTHLVSATKEILGMASNCIYHWAHNPEPNWTDSLAELRKNSNKWQWKRTKV